MSKRIVPRIRQDEDGVHCEMVDRVLETVVSYGDGENRQEAIAEAQEDWRYKKDAKMHGDIPYEPPPEPPSEPETNKTASAVAGLVKTAAVVGLGVVVLGAIVSNNKD